MPASNIVHLFWTGGWDSTFRLLDLLLVKERVVQPYYLIMPRGREAFPTEIRTINTIKRMLFQKAPACRTRLLPTVFRDASDVKPNATISAQYEGLRKFGFLSYQYELCARFAAEMDLSGMELSIHKDDRAHRFLEHSVILESDGSDSYYRLQKNPSNPDLLLFKDLRFPLFDLTKLDLEQLAARHGFGDILEHSWFCARPFRNGSPCGTCPPCRYTRREGLSRRIGMLGQIRYYLVYPLRFAISIGRPVEDWRT